MGVAHLVLVVGLAVVRGVDAKADDHGQQRPARRQDGDQRCLVARLGRVYLQLRETRGNVRLGCGGPGIRQHHRKSGETSSPLTPGSEELGLNA